MTKLNDIRYRRVEENVYQAITPDGHKMQIVKIGQADWRGSIRTPNDDVVGRRVSETTLTKAKSELYDLLTWYPDMVKI